MISTIAVLTILTVVLVVALSGLRWRLDGPAVGSALVSALIVAAIGLGVTFLSANLWKTYGLALFVLTPFVLGCLPVVIHGWRYPMDMAQAVQLAIVTSLFAGAMLMFFALEGAICIFMAAPLAIVIAAVGGMAGYALIGLRSSAAGTSMTIILLIGIAPGAANFERLHPRPSPVFAVTTTLDIAAPPEIVWRATIAPSRLPKPDDLIFRLGIAYPMAAHIEGKGPTATRYCNFSTGDLVEPVLTWEEPALLRFSVQTNPEPMREMSVYGRIHPPHLNGFLVSRQGQFRLIPLPGGGTRLEATTWYQHNLWPAQYWRWWSDFIIHRVHRQVLQYVRVAATA